MNHIKTFVNRCLSPSCKLHACHNGKPAVNAIADPEVTDLLCLRIWNSKCLNTSRSSDPCKGQEHYICAALPTFLPCTTDADYEC